MLAKVRRPSPAMVVALVALFSSLTGGAVAATAVPLAKKALFADNAGRLQGKTATQLDAQAAAAPGPASSAAALLTVKSAGVSVGARAGQEIGVSCDAGQKAISGGFSTEGAGLVMESSPNADASGWRMYVLNLDDAAGLSGTAFSVCLR